MKQASSRDVDDVLCDIVAGTASVIGEAFLRDLVKPWGLGRFGMENLSTEELAAKHIYEFLFVLTHAETRSSTAAVIAAARSSPDPRPPPWSPGGE